MSSKVPVLVLAFNRADHVEQAMKPIRQYKPDRIYLECDGPRPGNPGEVESVAATRRVLREMVDWPCEVFTLFRRDNLGCANAVSDALSWFFSQEEYGIVIEDDVIVSPDFFLLCEDLLVRYKDEDRIMEISAQNHFSLLSSPNTYLYTNDFHCWGWASWARAWNRMDMYMMDWPRMSLWKHICTFDVFRGCMMYYYWRNIYKQPQKNNSWASRWYFAIINHQGLVIQPGANLAVNIGMSGGAHYDATDVDPYAHLALEHLQWPLVYDDHVFLNRDWVALANRDFKRIRCIGAMKKIRKLFHW